MSTACAICSAPAAPGETLLGEPICANCAARWDTLVAALEGLGQRLEVVGVETPKTGP